jgi:putative ABC transport system substrate-binding protein
MFVNRAKVISLAAQHNVPIASEDVIPIEEGGLVSYGTDIGDIFRRAALYVDRILRGANPGELPVQIPTKFTMRLNLRTAKALGLTIPETLLATADEVIQ